MKTIPRKYYLVIIFSFLLTLMLACSLFGNSASFDTRTYYDSLNLDSPKEAVETFITAYQKSDYPTVLMVFSNRAQFVWVQYLNLLRYNYLFDSSKTRETIDDSITGQEGLNAGELSNALLTFTFDDYMLAAERNDSLWFDLSGNYKIQDEENETGIDRDHNAIEAIELTVDFDNQDEPIIFWLVESREGNWRVDRVCLNECSQIYELIWDVPELREE